LRLSQHRVARAPTTEPNSTQPITMPATWPLSRPSFSLAGPGWQAARGRKRERGQMVARKLIQGEEGHNSSQHTPLGPVNTHQACSVAILVFKVGVGQVSTWGCGPCANCCSRGAAGGSLTVHGLQYRHSDKDHPKPPTHA
jgi:hypothetical protein